MSEREKWEQYMMCSFPTANLSELDMTWKAWQAALSTRKPFGFGIVDKDGNSAVSILLTEGEAKSYAATFQVHSPEKELKAVSLFYEDSES